MLIVIFGIIYGEEGGRSTDPALLQLWIRPARNQDLAIFIIFTLHYWWCLSQCMVSGHLLCCHAAKCWQFSHFCQPTQLQSACKCCDFSGTADTRPRLSCHTWVNAAKNVIISMTNVGINNTTLWQQSPGSNCHVTRQRFWFSWDMEAWSGHL